MRRVIVGIAGLGIVGAMATTGITLAGSAQADPGTAADLAYLSELTHGGLVIHDIPAAVAEGHWVCTLMLSETGQQAAHDLYVTHAPPPGWTWTMANAGTIVIAAANTICPDAWGSVPPHPTTPPETVL